MSMTLTTQGNPMMPQSMDQAVRLAELMSHGKLVPNHLQKSPGDCLMVIEQAQRWGMSPFAVAQSTSVIQGKLMFEGKLVSAALHSSGLLQDRLNYRFEGEGDNRKVIAWATIRGESQPREVEVKLKDVKTNNGMWTKQPDQQLIYSANRIWGRRHAPEIMLGVYSPEEFEPATRSAEPSYAGKTIDGVAEPAAATSATPAKRSVGEWLADLKADLDAAANRAEVFAIVSRDDVQKAFLNLKPGPLAELQDITDEADRRYPAGDEKEAA
jgi:hypothetical protein